jgi:hypothetical protein
MLWWRRDPQTQAPGEAKRGQEAEAQVRQGRDPAIRVHRRRQNGRRMIRTRAATQYFGDVRVEEFATETCAGSIMGRVEETTAMSILLCAGSEVFDAVTPRTSLE